MSTLTRNVLVSGKLVTSSYISTFSGHLSPSRGSQELFLTRVLPFSSNLSSPFVDIISINHWFLVPGCKLCCLAISAQVATDVRPILSEGSQQLCHASPAASSHRKLQWRQAQAGNYRPHLAYPLLGPMCPKENWWFFRQTQDQNSRINKSLARTPGTVCFPYVPVTCPKGSVQSHTGSIL